MFLKDILNNLITSLSKRQKEIITQRFGLFESKPKTLAALGVRYGITRERIRQIETSALRSLLKMSENNKDIKLIYQKSLNHIKNLGGVRRADLLFQDLKFVLSDNNLKSSEVELLFTIFKSPTLFPENREFYSFWYISSENLKSNKEFISKVAKSLKNKKEEIISKKKFDELFYQTVRSHSISDNVAANFILNSKIFSANPYGDFGLAEWPEIVPKTIRDKSYLILKKKESPMHFKKIAEEINKIKFDSKKAHFQTVHNELIKDPRFVLVGRGLYGLKENGYEVGTAKDVIFKILKENGPLPVDKIVQLVSEQRVLKQNTILLNLQNKKYFKKINGGLYHVA